MSTKGDTCPICDGNGKMLTIIGGGILYIDCKFCGGVGYRG